jgi:hypothetical protein
MEGETPEQHERRTNAYVRGRLDAIQRGYERWVAYTLRLLAILVFIQLGLGALSVYLVGQNNQRAHDIQASRVDATRTTCLEQNNRHDHTIATLYAEIEKLRPTLTPDERKNLKRNIAANVALIDALAPKADCDRRTKRLTKLP